MTRITLVCVARTRSGQGKTTESLTAAGFPRRAGWESCNDGKNLMNANKMILRWCGATQAVVT